MVGAQSLADHVIHVSRSSDEMFELKPKLVQFVIEEEGIHESDAIEKVERLLPDVKERLKNRYEQRTDRGEPIEYQIVYDYIAPQPTDDIDEMRRLLDLFGQESGWTDSDHRHRNFEYFVGSFFNSLGAEDVYLTQFHNDGGYDVRGEFIIGTREVTIASIPFRVEARNKSNIEINEVDAVTGVLEDGEIGFYVSRNENYSPTQMDRAHPRVSLTTVGQLIQALRDDPDLLRLLEELVPPDPVMVPATSVEIDDFMDSLDF